MLLDALRYNGGDNTETEADKSQNKSARPGPDADEAEVLRYELQQLSGLVPDMSPQRIETLVEEFKVKKAAEKALGNG